MVLIVICVLGIHGSDMPWREARVDLRGMMGWEAIDGGDLPP
jgi:hypothetical protein